MEPAVPIRQAFAGICFACGVGGVRDQVRLGLTLSLVVGGLELGLAESFVQLDEGCGSGLRLEVGNRRLAFCSDRLAAPCRLAASVGLMDAMPSARDCSA